MKEKFKQGHNIYYTGGDKYEGFAYENYSEGILGTFFKREENGGKKYSSKIEK